MTPLRILGLLLPAAYVLGSVPFGLVIGWARGIDVRKAGSGNIGATNVGRLLGRPYFWLAFSLDMLKGLAPMLAASWVVHGVPEGQRDSGLYALWMAVGAAAVLGHVFSVFLGFKGGKGVATSAGVMIGLFPYFTVAGLAAMVFFVVLLAGMRYVSVASMGGAVAFPVLYVVIGLGTGWPVFGAQWPLLAFAAALAGLVVLRHRGNIARLRAGTESRIAWGSGRGGRARVDDAPTNGDERGAKNEAGSDEPAP